MDGNFFDNVNGTYQNNVVMAGPGGDPAMAPAAQPKGKEMDDDAQDNTDYHHNMEQDIPSWMLHHNDGPAAPPEAQPEVEEEATGNDQHHQIEEGRQPKPPEPDEPIYGLPCPAFSPEMIRLCSRMPWPSPTSLAAMLSGL
ncbi:hypothetical protein D1007_31246 [Hordeum vulgare]|nr:hypothetical protein D1007_31246 [Hordeum vulgare]